jgi:hypothetical protein
MGLSKKSIDFLNSFSIKAQGGLSPYISSMATAPAVNFATQIAHTAQNTALDPTVFGTLITPRAQVTQMAENVVGQDMSTFIPQVQEKMQPAPSAPPAGAASLVGQAPPKGDQLTDMLMAASPLLKIGMGVSEFAKGLRERKVAKFNERMFKEDYNKRKEALRDSFYMTPYTVGTSSDLTAREGGELQTITLYQMGGNSMDAFQNFYLNQESKKQQNLQGLNDFYTQTAKQQKAQADAMVQSGLLTTFQGVTDIAGKAKKAAMMAAGMPPMEYGGNVRQRALYNVLERYQQGGMLEGTQKLFPDFGFQFLEKQDGGTIKGEEQNFESVDLYSPNYVVPYNTSDNEFASMVKDEEERIIAEDMMYAQEDEEEELMQMSGVQPQGDYTVQDTINRIGMQESGGNYDAWNKTSNTVGKYQFMEKYWADKIRPYMGLPSNVSDRQTMVAFQKSPASQEGFMNHVVETYYLPHLPEMRQLGAKYGLNDDQLIRLMHYRGIKDAKDRLRAGNFEVSAKEKAVYNNPNVLEYLNK